MRCKYNQGCNFFKTESSMRRGPSERHISRLLVNLIRCPKHDLSCRGSARVCKLRRAGGNSKCRGAKHCSQKSQYMKTCIVGVVVTWIVATQRLICRSAPGSIPGQCNSLFFYLHFAASLKATNSGPMIAQKT